MLNRIKYEIEGKNKLSTTSKWKNGIKTCLIQWWDCFSNWISLSRSLKVKCKLFVCDFVRTMKVYKVEIFTKYQDDRLCYQSNSFFDFNSAIDFIHNIKMSWKYNLNSSKVQLVFECMGVLIWTKQIFDNSIPFHFISCQH